MKEKSNELVKSKLKIMRKSNSLHQIMRENNETKHVFKLRFFVTCYIVFVKKKRSKAKNNIIFSDQINKIYSLRT